MAAIVLGVAALGACVSACGSSGGSLADQKGTTTTSTTTTTTTPTTTTTTTTPPSTTTTTIRTAAVPDASEIGKQQGGAAAINDIKQAGFTYQILEVEWQSCDAGQPPKWDGGQVVGQLPAPGAQRPVGSSVELDVCTPSATTPTNVPGA